MVFRATFFCMMPYERLHAWRRSHELALAIYESTRTWPVEERYGLTVQARRAAVSVAANLAEGSARLGGRELRRFADISLGSLSELSCLLRIAKDLEYLSVEEFARLDEMRNSAGKVLLGLARAVGGSTPR
jgi:four helix bundle protein